jgi:hypothetical protein
MNNSPIKIVQRRQKKKNPRKTFPFLGVNKNWKKVQKEKEKFYIYIYRNGNCYWDELENSISKNNYPYLTEIQKIRP